MCQAKILVVLWVAICFVVISIHPTISRTSFSKSILKHFKGKISRESRQFGILDLFLPKPILNKNFTQTDFDVELWFPLPIPNDELDSESSSFQSHDSLFIGTGVTEGKVKISAISEIQQNRLLLNTYIFGIKNDTIQVVKKGLTDTKLNVVHAQDANSITFSEVEIVLEEELLPGDRFDIHFSYVVPFLNCQSAGIWPVYSVCPVTYETKSGEKRRYFVQQPLLSIATGGGIDDTTLYSRVTIVREKNYTSVFNSDLISSTPDDENPGWVKDKFAPIGMPLSKTGFISSDFPYVEATFGNHTARLHTTQDLHEERDYTPVALKTAKLMNVYSKYLDLSNISKIDAFILPNASDASIVWMNSGIVVLDLDENLGDAMYPYYFKRKEYKSFEETIILSTGILIGRLGDQILDPNHIVQIHKVILYIHFIGLKSVNSDISGTESAQLYILRDELEQRFDDSFNEEESEFEFRMLSMMEDVVGQKAVQEAVRSYLRAINDNKENKIINLLNYLQEVVISSKTRLPEGLTMQKLQENYNTQKGSPEVKVEQVNETHVKLSQEKFTKVSSEGKSSWYIPVTYLTSEQPEIQVVWLENNGEPKMIPVASTQWLLVNPKAKGFYRTLYDTSLLNRIQMELAADPLTFSAMARGQLLNDYAVYAGEELVDPRVMLNLTQNLKGETHYGIWRSLLNPYSGEFPFLANFTSHPKLPLLRNYFQTLIDSSLTAIGPNPTGAAAVLQEELLHVTCKWRGSLCTEYAEQGFEIWKNGQIHEYFGGSEYDDDDDRVQILKQNFKCGIVAAIGAQAVDYAYNEYNNSSARNLKRNGLDCISEPVFIRELLRKVLNASTLKAYNSEGPFLDLALQPKGQAEIMPFLSANIEKFISMVGKGNVQPVAIIVDRLSDHFSTEKQLKEVKTFIEDNKMILSPVMTELEKSVRKIEKNIVWMDISGSKILEWFSKQERLVK